MDEELLEVRRYEGAGYKPLVDYGNWRVAILRPPDESSGASTSSMERHLQTDEVFVLTKGRATLVIGGNAPEITRLEFQQMEIGAVYNVKRCAWHTVVLSADASMMIVENRDTGDGNSEQGVLSVAQQLILRERVAQLGLDDQADS